MSCLHRLVPAGPHKIHISIPDSHDGQQGLACMKPLSPLSQADGKPYWGTTYFSWKVSTSLTLVVPQIVLTIMSESWGTKASLTAVCFFSFQDASRTRSIPSGGKLSSTSVATVVEFDSPLQIVSPVLAI